MPQYHPENTKVGTDGSQKLVGMIQDTFAKDTYFYPIPRSLLPSTDDTTSFIIPVNTGTHCKDNEMLFSSVHDKKTQIYYNKSCYDNDDKHAKVMHVKLNFTFIGEVQLFNPYITVSGMT